MSQKIAVVLLLGFMSGVSLRSFIDFGWALAGFLILLAFVFGVISLSFENKKIALVLVLFLFSAGLGIGRYEIKDARDNIGVVELNKFVGERVELTGIVSDEPDERENYSRLIITLNKPKFGTTHSELKEEIKVLVYSRLFPEFKYGDGIKLSGELKKPSDNFGSGAEGKNSFRWKDYLSKDEIYFEMIYPGIELVASNRGNWVKAKLFTVKQKYLEALARVLPEPHASFMGGLTIGAKQSMPKDLQEDFRETGVIHMVVLSGYNITLVADTAMRVFSFLPQVFSFSLGLIGIILFATMTGGSATVIRASFMAILVLLARWTGRVYTITWTLFLVAFFMILNNPKILRFDAGFQLSFLATLALIYLEPIFDKWLCKKVSCLRQGKFRDWFLKKDNGFRGIISSTTSVQIFVLPVLLYKMEMFSVVSLPVNFLVLVFVPLTMFFGFITGWVGLFSTALAMPFSWISFLFLQYELFVVKFFARLPFASFSVSSFPLWLVVGCYLFLGWIIWRSEGKRVVY